MLNKSVEKTIAWFLFIGVPFTTLFLMTDSVSDPVNVTKLFAAGCIGGGVFAIVLVYGFKELWVSAKLLVVASVLFIAAGVNSVVNSSAAMTQNLYGIFGRQTGLITYLLLIMTMLGAALLRARRSFDLLVWHF